MFIPLGSKVKDKVTGFIGVAVSRTEYLNGCTQYSVAPKVDKDNKMLDEYQIDEQCLEIVGKRKKIKKERVGGKTRKSIPMGGH